LIGAWVVLIIGLSVAVALGAGWERNVNREARSSFAGGANGVTSALAASLRSDLNFDAFQESLITSFPQLSNRDLSTVYQEIDLAKRYPGGIGVGYIERVPSSQLAAFESSVEADPPIHEPVGSPYAVFPAGNRAEYCLIRFGIATTPLVLPTTDFCSPILPGIGRSPIPPVLERATNQGSPTVLTLASVEQKLEPAMRAGLGGTSSPHLSGISELKTLFVVVFPVFPGGTIPGSVAERQRLLTGWVIGTFSGKALIASALGSSHGLGLSLLFRQTTGTTTLIASGGRHGTGFVRTESVSGDRSWLIEVTGSSSTSALQQGLAVGGLGVVISILLFLFLVHLARSRERALRMVDERTSELRYETLHDSLTDLPNRALIYDRAERMLARSKRHANAVGALFIDLDNFKDINDTFGHVVGDKLIQAVATRLATTVRGQDTVGRLGGDEFVVLVEDETLNAGGGVVAERIRSALAQPFEIPGPEPFHLTVHASIGVAIGARDGADDLLRDADIALYEAKAAGKDQFAIFQPEMHTAIQERLELQLDLRRALETDQLFVLYQPTLNLRQLTVTGAEALLRWRHPTRGVVPPTVFIPIAEESDLIMTIGRFVLERACAEAASWERLGYRLAIAVNVSARQLENDDFVQDVRRAVELHGLPAELLILEITESVLMRDSTVERLRSLKEVGVRIAVDDFGTGFSSLAYLSRFPVDLIKIDRSFISGDTHTDESGPIVRSVITLAKALGLETVAEGIETDEQLAYLQTEGCENGQGYLFARPLESKTLLRFLANSELEERSWASGVAP
jgi:diguanylate cyclase (GGDEF)-like protein